MEVLCNLRLCDAHILVLSEVHVVLINQLCSTACRPESEQLPVRWGWCDLRGVPGLVDVGTHAPVLSLLCLPVTSLVDKVCLSSDRVPPLMEPQWLVAFIFSTYERSTDFFLNFDYSLHLQVTQDENNYLIKV